MSEEALAAIKDYLEQGKPFEVKFEGNSPTVSEAKGISKVSLTPEELKKAKIKKTPKRKVVKEQKSLISSAAEIFLEKKVGFKVVFGTDESTIRFDLDHYLRLARDKEERVPEKCTVVGFNSLDESPVVFIKELLSIYPNVKLLAPKR
jgi:hypothetical protein